MIGLALTLAAAASDPLGVLLENETRVATVAYRLQANGGALCTDKMPLWGMVLHDRAQYAPRDLPEVAKRFGLGDRPSVLVVVKDGPAARAGIQGGHAIAAINGIDVPVTPRDATGYAPLAAIEARLDAAGPRARVSIVGHKAGSLGIEAAMGCRSRVQIIPGNKRNAHADGFYVQLTHAMIAETESEDELAFVIAHEMAHNILGHRAKRARKALRSRDAESEADRLAIRLMRNARYDVDAGARFWARFGAKTGYGIFSDGTHLRTKARVKLLADAAAETRAQ